MPTIRRLSDSCVLVTTDTHATLIDPGFHPFTSGAVDLDTIGDVDRVLITHEHADHVNPDFVRWLRDRHRDLTVHSNQAVAELLDGEGIEVSTGVPSGVGVEDTLHEPIPTGDRPPNRSFTVEGILTHPGDSHEPAITAPVLALPMIAPWTSATAATAFARRLAPERVIPIHDFFLSELGREFIPGLVAKGLEGTGIEVVPLGWGESMTV